jgi:hypothetical protein
MLYIFITHFHLTQNVAIGVFLFILNYVILLHSYLKIFLYLTL